MSAVSLRPYLPANARRCAEIFRSSIEELAAEDYGDEQREAWAARADDEHAFGDDRIDLGGVDLRFAQRRRLAL